MRSADESESERTNARGNLNSLRGHILGNPVSRLHASCATAAHVCKMAVTKQAKRESTVDAKQVSLAVPALFSYIAKKKSDSKKKAIFGDAQSVWILLSLKNIPKPDRKPRLLPLPNPLFEECEICLFTKQPGKEVKEFLKSKGIENISKVISLTKLRKNYKSFEEKRKLCSSYERFLCDDRIYHLLPKCLGKAFFGKKKQPTPVNLLKSDLKSEIDQTVMSTTIEFGHGPCSSVRVGHTGQSPDAVEENIMTCCSHIAKCVPRGWQNIQCLHIKTSDSVALPIYNSLPDFVEEESEEPEKRKSDKEPAKKKKKTK